MMRFLVTFLIFFCFLQQLLQAEIVMPVLFGDGMVFQRNAAIRVYGQASEGTEITVKLDQQVAKAVTKSGKWRVELEPMSAGGPYRLEVSGGQSHLIFDDVMLGEVWLASGQSNMAMQLQITVGFESHLPEKVMPNLRYVMIPVTEFGPIDRKKVRWKSFDPKTSKQLSAVAYFFARELQRRLGDVPVAIIASYKGGTWNENWMTPESIRSEPKLKYLFEDYEREYSKFENEEAYEQAYQQFLVELQKWREKGGWSHGMIPFAPLGPKA